MKTLYININGENIQSSNDIIVVGTPDDAIVDKFYYELGKEIVKGVDAPGIRGLAKHIVKSYKDIDELSFDKITMQWLNVKDKLLGEYPTGSETIELPKEYVKWLQNYGDASHTEIAKSLYARNCLVEISLDKIYRNSVNIIINSIELDNYGQFVVNDEVVTDDSAISTAIMNKFDGIAFKPYKKEDVCPNCGKNPCECPKTCPKCGKEPCECSNDPLFPIDGIILGRTSLADLVKEEKIDIPLETPQSIRKHFESLFEEGTTHFSKGMIDHYGNGYYDVFMLETAFRYIQFLGYKYFSIVNIDFFGKMPQSWGNYFGFSNRSSLQEVKNILATKGFEEVKNSRISQDSKFKYLITFFIERKKYFVSLFFGEDHVNGGLILYSLSLELVNCPYCSSKEVKYNINLDYDLESPQRNFIMHQCNDCNHRWDNFDLSIRCSECGSYGTTYRTKKNHLKCIVCGHSI